MRGRQQPADEPYDSPFAMTILPGKAARTSNARGTGKSRKQDATEEFTPAPASMTPATFAAPPIATVEVAPSAPQAVAAAYAGAPVDSGPVVASYALDYPAAPGFPLQPHYAGAHVGGDLLPSAGTQPGHGTPGVPPAGYAPLNFLDDHDAPEPQGKKSRTPLLIAAALVVALAAGGYYEVPKLLNSKKPSSPTTTLVLPAKIGQLAKQTLGAAIVAKGLATLHAANPALANVQVGVYGSDASIVVMAGKLPKSVAANTTAQQVALIKSVDAAIPTDTGAARHLVAVPQAAGTGQFWCALLPAAAGSTASTNCIAVDSQAILLLTVYGPNEQANVRRATTIRGLVEHP